MSVPVATLVSHVLVNGLAVYAPGEPIKPADALTVLDAINTVLDDWNADTQAHYAETFPVYTFSGTNPQTIGPTGTWVTAARPVAIAGVAVDVSSGGGTYQPIYTTSDPRWWEPQPSATGAYYAADEPNGSLYFSAPPAAGTNIRLMMRTTLGPVLLTDVMTLPQGYQSALELTVMEAVVDAFHATLTPSQIQRAGKARGRIWANNLRIPSLSTRGLGLPGSGSGSGPTVDTGTSSGGGFGGGFD
jgi:hypothetical protein